LINISKVEEWMKSNAYEPTTIKQTKKRLRFLMSNCDTNNPEEVKKFVSNKNCSNAYKECLIETYDINMKSKKKQWNKPFYSRYDKKRKAPKEQLIDFIILHARPVTRLKLMVEKDLGTRPIELFWLKVGDVDLTNGNVSITGAKHTVGREGKLKANTLAVLKVFIEQRNLRMNDQIFKGRNADNFAENFRHLRNSLAKKYSMPELKQVQLYDFRRFKASKEYHLSRNILLVKQLLGHKHIDQTEKYISLFDEANITWIPVVAETDEEIKQAIQDDCIFVCQTNGKTYFKKPA
jgi:integrase